MYNKVNAKLSQSQINKLKHAAQNKTGVTLRISNSMLGKDEENFPHELMLTNTQVAKLRKQKAANIKLSKAQMSKMAQSGGFLSTLLKFGMPLLKNVIAPLGLTAAMSATDAGIQKKIWGKGVGNTTLVISNQELSDIFEIIKLLEEKGILVKGTTEATKSEAQKQKGGFLGMLLGTLGASLLGNMLAGKGVIRAGEGVIRAGQDF